MVYVTAWENFWTSVWESIKKAFAGLYNYWFVGSSDTAPFLTNFLLAIIVLVAGLFLIKLLLRLIRKAMKVDKRFVKEETVKSFFYSCIRIALYIGLFVLVVLILKVDLSNASQIFSSALLAIGISLQDVVKNFASGLIILSTKPFAIGDFVCVAEDVEGTIKKVQFLNTTIVTINGQVVVVSNTAITSAKIINYSRYPVRRAVIELKVDYQENIDLVKSLMLKAVENDNRILENPAPKIVVSGFDQNSVTVSLRYHIANTLYWDTLYDVNERIAKIVKENNIKLGFNQVVYTTREEYIGEKKWVYFLNQTKC